MLEVMMNNNISWEELFAYVDDLRTVMEALKEGTMFCGDCKSFFHSTHQESIDRGGDESDTRRTARLMKELFNSIESDIV